MALYGFASEPGRALILDAHGQLKFAASPADKMRRLLSPLWGPVWCEAWRGNAPWPRGVDALDVIIADRIVHLLSPMVDSGEISDVTVRVLGAEPAPDGSKRRRAAVGCKDEQRRTQELSVFVRIP